jgi:hypothetical protein
MAESELLGGDTRSEKGPRGLHGTNPDLGVDPVFSLSCAFASLCQLTNAPLCICAHVFGANVADADAALHMLRMHRSCQRSCEQQLSYFASDRGARAELLWLSCLAVCCFASVALPELLCGKRRIRHLQNFGVRFWHAGRACSSMHACSVILRLLRQGMGQRK